MITGLGKLVLTTLLRIPEKEYYSKLFLQGMINRIGMSHFKYGLMSKTYPYKVNAIATMKDCIKLYEKTGNLEYLIDAANYGMIEFMYPRHHNAHFRSTDSNESPGQRK
jgi:hypothetical protein